MNEFCSDLDGQAVAFWWDEDGEYYSDVWCINVWAEDGTELGAECLRSDSNQVYFTTIANVEGTTVSIPPPLTGVHWDNTADNGYFGFQPTV